MSTVARVDRLPGGDDGAVALVVIVVAEARRAEPPTLLYAALRGSCALGLASSTLRPTSRSDRPTSTPAPSRIRPARGCRARRSVAPRRRAQGARRHAESTGAAQGRGEKRGGSGPRLRYPDPHA